MPLYHVLSDTCVHLFRLKREELDQDEYETTKQETEEQLFDIRKTLSRMESGDMTLVDSNNSQQLVRLFVM